MHKLLPEALNPFGKKFLLFQLALWGSYGVVYRMAWYSYQAPPYSWIISYIALGFLSSTLLATLVWQVRAKSFRAQLLLGLLGAIIFGVSWRVTFHIIEWHVIEIYVPENIRLFSYVHNGMMSVVYLIAWVAGYFLAAYYSNYLIQQERAAKAELLAKDAQIKLLHLQISPHFLFNVLNSLDTLLLKENIEGSREMLSKLSQFLRQTLSDNPSHNIPLKEEIERTKSYLDIELVRFRDKLDIKWECDVTLNKLTVPSLILQPLVENAIKHSVGKSLHGGTIEIEATKKTAAYELAVINRTKGEEAVSDQACEGLGIGHENIKSRLNVLYGDQAALSKGPTANGGYEVRITINKDVAEFTE